MKLRDVKYEKFKIPGSESGIIWNVRSRDDKGAFLTDGINNCYYHNEQEVEVVDKYNQWIESNIGEVESSYIVEEKKPGDILATAIFTLADGSKQHHHLRVPDNDIIGEAKIETSAGIQKEEMKWSQKYKDAGVKDPIESGIEDTIKVMTVESVAKDGAKSWEEEKMDEMKQKLQYEWGDIGKIDYNQIAQETPWVHQSSSNYMQVVPDSQWYSTLEQIQSAVRLIKMRYQTGQVEAKDYGAGIWLTTLAQEIHELLVGIDNTIQRGYQISKIEKDNGNSNKLV